MDLSKRHSRKESQDRLFQIADSQQGYFTTQQAAEAGYNAANTSYHVTAGNWIREARGIYRLKNYPTSEQGELVLWSLWSRNRDQIPLGVYSHQTALDVQGLTELLPSKLHMTVPPGFRRSEQSPSVLELHTGKLSQEDIRVMRGFSVTRPLRTIKDLLAEKSVPTDLLAQALERAIRQGLLTTRGIGNEELLSLQALFRTIS